MLLAVVVVEDPPAEVVAVDVVGAVGAVDVMGCVEAVDEAGSTPPPKVQAVMSRANAAIAVIGRAMAEW